MALLWEPWRQLAPAWMPPTPLYINPRNFLFTALLPFSLGLSTAWAPKAIFAGGLVLIGLLIQTVEILLLPTSPYGQPCEYFLGSAILGAALFWSGLHWNPRWAGNIPWGAASLPMYLLQLILFSVMLRFFEWPLAHAIHSVWNANVGAICFALPLYAFLCMKLARTNLWRRIHS
jgi:hypothetical protein